MRGDGYDITPIRSHYIFLFTSILSLFGWFLAFIGQAIAQAKLGIVAHQQVGVLWFAIFLQLAVILGVWHTLATDSVALHRFQISVFGSVALVFSVTGVNQGIFTNVGSLEAMAAGWLLLAIANIIWLLYFTSEENSLSLYLFNMYGTGGLTGPGRNGFRPGGRRMTASHVNMQNGGGAGYSSGIGGGPDYAPPNMMGGGISGGYDTKEPGIGVVDHSQIQRSLGGGGSVNSNDPGSRGGMGETASPSTVPQPMGPSSIAGDIQNPSTPLMASGNLGSSGDAASIPETYLYRAKALYAYSASADDPNEISFSKGEILDIVDKTGKWWQAKRSDGTTGNYLQVI
ncbi:hypothetical protein JB92DRAFT_3082402 [Gautieria morchelliformis]|nr:hypothetical protein JB92DRAFT_3082402 [Gautieria morchelliformis]